MNLDKDKIEQKLKSFFIGLSILRAPIFLSICIALIFVFPGQMHELYRNIAQNYLSSNETFFNGHREFIFAAFGLILVSATLWFVCRKLSHVFYYDKLKNEDRSGELVLKFCIRCLPIIPLLSLALGVYFSMDGKGWSQNTIQAIEEGYKNTLPNFLNPEFLKKAEEENPGFTEKLIKEVTQRMLDYKGLLFYITISLIFSAIFLLLFINYFERKFDFKIAKKQENFLHSYTHVSLAVSFIFLILIFSIFPLKIPTYLGSFLIITLFFFMLTLVLSELSCMADKTGIPILFLIVLSAIIYSAFPTNDNHDIRQLKEDKVLISSLKHNPKKFTASNQFQQWYDNRKDKEKFETNNKPYPVYIVAAQGGGVYAAFHTAHFLASLKDECPSFNHHLFAISSVSGGSVGSAVYANFLKNLTGEKKHKYDSWKCGMRPKQPMFSYADAVHEYFKYDFLSPLTSSFFFQDFSQRFIPFPIYSFDRAKPLEYAFEDAWKKKLTKYREKYPDLWKGEVNYLTQPVSAIWNVKDDTPALLMNATEVGTGERRIIAPFTFKEKSLNFYPVWKNEKKDKKYNYYATPLSTAAGVTARFPWLTPAAFFYDDGQYSYPKSKSGKWKKVRLVDGGYFDNSGVATAVDLITTLKEYVVKSKLANKIEFRLIVLTSESVSEQTYFGFGESMAPIRTFLNTHNTKSKLMISTNKKALKEEHTSRSNMDKITLQNLGYQLPLGWRLSPVSRLLISAQVGSSRRCKDSDNDTTTGIFKSDCVVASIITELRD